MNRSTTDTRKPLTWFECSRDLHVGDQVVFLEDWDIFSEGVVVPCGTHATVTANNLNELDVGLWVLPDDEKIKAALEPWEGNVLLGTHLDPGADVGEVTEWQSDSPVTKVPFMVQVFDLDDDGKETLSATCYLDECFPQHGYEEALADLKAKGQHLAGGGAAPFVMLRRPEGGA